MPHLSALLTLSLVVGIAGGVNIDAPFHLVGALTMSAAWAAAVLAYARGHHGLQLVSVAVLVAAAGWVLGAHGVERALHPPLRSVLEQRVGGFALDGSERRTEEPIVIEGRLRQDAALTSTGANVRLDVEGVWLNGVAEPAAGGVSLGISGVMQATHLGGWTAGRRVRAPALLRRPARYLNHGLPDQERALARRGVSLVGSIKSAALVEVLNQGRWWEEAAAAIRARTRAALARHVRPQAERSAAIATAILIGDRAGLDADLERRLQEAGTYHVIAISGGNIAILAGLLLGGMAWLGVRGRLAALAVIAALAAYAVIAASPSVQRATLMAVVYLAVRVIDQRTAAVNAISLTAGVILLISPLAIVDVGFWLTFGATMALVTGASLGNVLLFSNVSEPNRALARPSVRATRARAGGEEAANEPRHRLGRIGGPLIAVLAGTICVELALAPIAALIFQRVTIAGLLLNFVALPAMSVVQLGAMAVVACDLVGSPAVAGWIGQGVHLAAVVLTESTRLLDLAPWLTWRVPPPHLAVLGAYYVALIAALAMHVLHRGRGWQRGLRAAVVALLLWIVAAPAARIRATGDGQLHLTMLDVGQGDAALVTFPNGRTLLVDAGGLARGDFDIGDRVIGPTLRARGLLALDYLAVTHGDADHVGGAQAMVRDFAPREVWWGVPVAQHEATAAVRAEADRQRIPWRTLQRGDRLDVGAVELRLHHPPQPDWERQRVRNNDSLVLELRFGRVSVLLTGDIEREVENALSQSLDLLPVAVLKVAHHGSGTSSSPAFVDQVRPRVAVIGVGRGNPYGHPVPYVLGRLHDVGAEVFRTDRDGQIELVTDGSNVEVMTWTGRKVTR